MQLKRQDIRLKVSWKETSRSYFLAYLTEYNFFYYVHICTISVVILSDKEFKKSISKYYFSVEDILDILSDIDDNIVR